MTLRMPHDHLPLLPMQTVLFPGGLLSMKVVEARHRQLMSDCFRERSPFGVVAVRPALRQAAEVPTSASEGHVALEQTGVMAELIDLDRVGGEILKVRCRGVRRFRLTDPRLQGDGSWCGTIALLQEDADVAPAADQLDSVRGLATVIAKLKREGKEPFLPPYRLDLAGWVANRWCELLPISAKARQRLMELEDPAVRLRLVNEFLREKGVV